MSEKHGRCACGAIRFVVNGPVSEVVACHCRTCRRVSGFYWAAVVCSADDLSIDGSTLAWWSSSTRASRGFCATCGSSLFFKKTDSAQVSIAPGVIDTPLGQTVARHIFCAEAGDYYTLDDAAMTHDADR
ncbi:MAG: aldehyde-activating protein [Xanthomonadales bacterium]|nr:aldehyde-activating protein [Xanthomonadales bacterium]|tara:strand:- start:346 stop:735 length:390 start_codon:yes stop_codon:yes gene_type:complete